MCKGETPKPVGGDTFLACVYRIHDDECEWREYTRESLLQEVAHRALWSQFMEWRGRHIRDLATRRAVFRVYLVDVMGSPTLKLVAHAVVLRAWGNWWDTYGPSVDLARSIGSEHARELRGDTLRDMLSAVGA